MRIKRVEIIGFKSFCDRAVVNFGESITGVVGPNGCGKSNIVDAIRWCMGEQSAKHLRGKAMEDVIFAGSEIARPRADGRGLADVRRRRVLARDARAREALRRGRDRARARRSRSRGAEPTGEGDAEV